jgi:hypothetical protein
MAETALGVSREHITKTPGVSGGPKSTIGALIYGCQLVHGVYSASEMAVANTFNLKH